MSSTRLSLSSSDATLFVKIAETLSFKTAGDALGISRSAVSKRISRLETSLGATLVNRTSRALSLSELGKVLVSHCREIEATVTRAETAILNQDLRATGTVRFSVSASLGRALMPALVDGFSKKYPDVRLSVHVAESFVDVIAGGFDVVLRIAETLPDSRLSAFRLATTSSVLVASPDYLKSYGRPTRLQDLENHRCIGLSEDICATPVWKFHTSNGTITFPVKYAFNSNSSAALNIAACRGAGILQTAEILVAEELNDKRLVNVLSQYSYAGELGVFALYPGRILPKKVRVFVEFVRREVDRLSQLNARVQLQPISA